jgi:hypothetical protein
MCNVIDGIGWGNDGESNDLAHDLEVGDSFVVRAELGNVEGMDFYIVQCVE